MGKLRRHVTWANYVGTVLCVTNVPYGETPAYNGATPTKPATDTTRFTFSGWTQTVVPVTGATTYTAKYDARVYLIDLSLLTVAYTALDGDVLINSTTQAISIENNATVTLSGITSPGLRCLGNATIVLADGTANTLNGPLRAGGTGTTLTIEGGTGSLSATGSNQSAGIGAVMDAGCGNIVIEGGVITAYGSSYNTGAGIGAARNGGCGNITIKGGTVTACGGADGAGIGACWTAGCGHILIAGGTVTATGSGCNPGIGSSNHGGGYNTITISGGTVMARGSYGNASASNDAAIGGNGGDIRIESTIAKVVAQINCETPIKSKNGIVTIAEGLDDVRIAPNELIGNLTRVIGHDLNYNYNITWINYDGSVLCVTNVPYGITPVYNGSLPTRPSTQTTRFTFDGWVEDVVPATCDATYTAKHIGSERLVDLSMLTANYTAQTDQVLIGTTTYAVSIADNATVTLSGITSPGLTCLGNATIVLADGTANT